MGLHHRNLNSNTAFEKAKLGLVRLKPKPVWVSPPCTQFSAIQNLKWPDVEGEKAKHKHAQYYAATRGWGRYLVLVNLQVDLGGHAHVENPLLLQAWHFEPGPTRKCLARSFQLRRDGCMDSFKNSKGDAVLKSFRIQSSDPAACDAFAQQGKH